MFRTLRLSLIALFALCALGITAQAESMPNAEVGYYVSSTGTPVKIAYSGDEQKVLLQFRNADFVDGWLASGRDGRISITYKSSDGTTMLATQLDKNTFQVKSQSSSFTAIWRRR